MAFLGQRASQEAVLLLFPADVPVPAQSTEDSAIRSFLGGVPSPGLARRTPRCRCCGEPMVHLMQLDAPCQGASKRCMNVFACRGSACSGLPGTVRVFRSQERLLEARCESAVSHSVPAKSAVTTTHRLDIDAGISNAALATDDDWSGLDASIAIGGHGDGHGDGDATLAADEDDAWAVAGDAFEENAAATGMPGLPSDDPWGVVAPGDIAQQGLGLDGLGHEMAGAPVSAWGAHRASESKANPWAVPESGSKPPPATTPASNAPRLPVPAPAPAPVPAETQAQAAAPGRAGASDVTGGDTVGDASGDTALQVPAPPRIDSKTRHEANPGTGNDALHDSARPESATAAQVLEMGENGKIALPRVDLSCSEEPWEALEAGNKGRGGGTRGKAGERDRAGEASAEHIEEMYQKYLASEREEAGGGTRAGGGGGTGSGRGRGGGGGGGGVKRGGSGGRNRDGRGGNPLDLLPDAAFSHAGDSEVGRSKGHGGGGGGGGGSRGRDVEAEDDSDDDDMRAEWRPGGQGRVPAGAVGQGRRGRQSTASSVVSWRSEVAELEEGPGLAGTGPGGWRLAGDAEGSSKGKRKGTGTGSRGHGHEGRKGSSGAPKPRSTPPSVAGGSHHAWSQAEGLRRFRARVGCAPTQIARYAYGGVPLWPTGAPPAGTRGVPTVPMCRQCGASCEFEVQLLPSLIAEAEAGAGAGAGVPAGLLLGTDFLSVFVWSCSASCGGKHTYVKSDQLADSEHGSRVVIEEFAWVVPPLGTPH